MTDPRQPDPAYGAQLPPSSWQQGQPPPQGPKSPRWLWIAAGAAVLLAVALVIALVITNGSVKRQTAVPPLPAMPGSTTATSPASTTTAPSTDSATPTEAPGEAGMRTVVYQVTGEGRAISITYRDTGDVIQTEFNVALPWSKQVSLPKSGDYPANVTIVNIGNEVTCSVTVAGAPVRQHTGVGLTVCDAPS